jgi:Protein of unknown function (DUF2927)
VFYPAGTTMARLGLFCLSDQPLHVIQRGNDRAHARPSIRMGAMTMMFSKHSAYRAALIVGVVACLLGAGLGRAEGGQPDQRTVRWLEEVLLGAEYGGDGRLCARWTRQPTLSTYFASPEQSELVADLVGELNDVLSQTSIKGIALLPAQDDTADIRVYFVPLSRFRSLSAELGFPYSDRDHGYFWGFWDRSHGLRQVHVLLATDILKGRHLRHFALEEITQSLGPMSDSAIYPDSAFYANGPDGGDAQHLSALDRKALYLLYAWLRPGDGRDELLAAVRDHWPD